MKADYPTRFINSVIKQFQDKSNQRNVGNLDEYIILTIFFDIPKSFMLTELPFFENEVKSKHFLKKFHHFTKDCFEIDIKWKGKTFFSLKEKSVIIIIINRFYLAHPLYMILPSNITFTQYTHIHNIKTTILFDSGHPVATLARSFDNFFCVTT